MSMMIEDKRNNELTITNTCKSEIYQISKIVWIKYLIMTSLKVMSSSIVPKQSHTSILHIYSIYYWYVLWRPKRSWDLQKESRWRYAIERHTIHQIDQSTNTHTSSRSSVGYLSPSPRSATVYLCIISHFVFVYGTHLIILGQLMVRHREEPGGPLQRVGAARLEVEGAQAPILQFTHEVLARGSMICSSIIKMNKF